MVLAAVLALALAPVGVSVTFVRHAETVANATGVYNAKTLNAFSEKGEHQVRELTASLESRRFDRIFVSPSPRALRTIEPYLRKTGQIAVVSPLLYECCTGKRPAEARPTRLQFGAKFELPAGTGRVFTVEPGKDRLPASPDFGSGLAQVEASVRDFWERNPAGRVLIVGHSGHGGEFIYRLTGRRVRVENAKPIVFAASRQS